MTKAQRIAKALGMDGQIFETPDGTTLEGLCRGQAGSPVYRDGHGTDTYRYDFSDDSSIVVAGSGWDLGLPGAYDRDCYCWNGNGCQCDEE